MTSDVLAPGLPGPTKSDVDAVIAAADEAEWLAEKRRDAWRLYESMDLPDPGDEEWRRTNLREMKFPSVRPARLTLSPVERRADGVVVADLSTASREQTELIQRYLGETVHADEWKFVALNSSLWTDGRLIHVPAGVEADVPVSLATSGLADGAAGFTRVLVVAERNSRVRIVDDSSSVGGGFTSGVVEILIGEGAKVEYYDINRWGDGVLNFKTVRAILGRDAEFVGLAAGIGSKLTKMRFDVEMPESGARMQLLGVTFGSGKQHFDYNTLQNHTGKNTISDLQFKSALTGSASLVWYGVTRINETAGGSEANQTSRNLLLSEHAKASPIPVLEIKAHDVSKCSHGATAGPVDENELFYLQARAISRETAESMLVEGFFASVIDRVPDAALRARLLEAVLVKAGGAAAGGLTFDEMQSA